MIVRLLLFLTMVVSFHVAMAQDVPSMSIGNRLKERLSALQQKGFAYGHQDDTFYGVEWKWQQGLEKQELH